MRKNRPYDRRLKDSPLGRRARRTLQRLQAALGKGKKEEKPKKQAEKEP